MYQVMIGLVAAALALMPGEASFAPIPVSVQRPVQRMPRISAKAEAAAVGALPEFAAALPESAANQVVGVYSPGVLALRIQQQPAGAPAFVSETADAATMFSLARKYGTIGLLAHNHLAGSAFFDLRVGMPIATIFGDGTVGHYIVTKTERYRALEPSSPYSHFTSLNGDGSRLSSTDLFYATYAGDGELVFQTCIARGDDPSWGRYFVTAVPVKIRTVARFARDFGAHQIQFH
jgi:hypothetical protein